MRLLTNIKACYKRTGLKIGCLAGFCHYRLTTMSAHTHAYRYPLFECGMKTGLWKITLCRKDIALLRKNTKNNSTVYYSYNDNWCTAGYGDLIIGIL